MTAGTTRGTVVFIGAGPGAADLITLRGARWLAPDPLARFGALLWRVAPAWYLASVRRRFGGELR